MRSIAIGIGFVFLTVTPGCGKGGGEAAKAGGAEAQPAAPAALAAAAPAPPAVAPKPALPAGARELSPGAPVDGNWDEGGPPPVVWKTADGAQIVLSTTGCNAQKGDGGEGGDLEAVTPRGKEKVLTYACDTAGGGRVGFLLGADGKVGFFNTSYGARGQELGSAEAFLLSWDSAAGTLKKVGEWKGDDIEAPPPWASLSAGEGAKP
jgi:hypothetical protein